MKRFSVQLLSLLLSAVLIFSLVACGETNPDVGGSNPSQSVESSSDRTSGTESDASENDGSETATDGTSDTILTDSDFTESNTDQSTDSQTAQTTQNTQSTQSATNSSKPSDSDTNNSGSQNTDTPKPTVNTDISPIQPKDYYGRTWLLSQSNGANLVKDYDTLAAGIESVTQKITLSQKLTANEFNLVLNCYLADYPQHFWLGKSWNYETIGGKVSACLPSYTMDAATKAKEQKKFNDTVNSFLADINKNMTQFEIEKTLHDRLILACRYDESAHAHDAYGALVEGVAVCEGYSRAFEHLCRSVGIQTLYVTGSSLNPATGIEEGHAWNIVKIDGKYYHTDTTWDDAGEPNKDNLHYVWFNLTTNQIQEDHTLTQTAYPYPNCAATDANFYKQNGMETSSLTVDNVMAKIKKQGNSYIFHCYVKTVGDPQTWFSNNARAIATRLGLNGYSYKLQVLGHDIWFSIK
ncbi:MAG: hypothetical protein IIY12_03715 [Clostridia bacterium]|nr:hypothetical protein [Clostridia bacterium]